MTSKPDLPPGYVNGTKQGSQSFSTTQTETEDGPDGTKRTVDIGSTPHGQPAAAVSTSTVSKYGNVGSTLEPGQELRPGQSLVSKDGLYRLTFNPDGKSVVMYGPTGSSTIWSGKDAASQLAFQKDGDLVLYKAGTGTNLQPLWSSQTSVDSGNNKNDQNNDQPTKVVLQDGKLLILDKNGNPVTNPKNIHGEVADVQPYTYDAKTNKYTINLGTIPAPTNQVAATQVSAMNLMIKDTQTTIQYMIDQMGTQKVDLANNLPFSQAPMTTALSSELSLAEANTNVGQGTYEYNQNLQKMTTDEKNWQNAEIEAFQKVNLMDGKRLGTFSNILRNVDSIAEMVQEVGMVIPPTAKTVPKDVVTYLYGQLKSDVSYCTNQFNTLQNEIAKDGAPYGWGFGGILPKKATPTPTPHSPSPATPAPASGGTPSPVTPAPVSGGTPSPATPAPASGTTPSPGTSSTPSPSSSPSPSTTPTPSPSSGSGSGSSSSSGGSGVMTGSGGTGVTTTGSGIGSGSGFASGAGSGGGMGSMLEEMLPMVVMMAPMMLMMPMMMLPMLPMMMPMLQQAGIIPDPNKDHDGHGDHDHDHDNGHDHGGPGGAGGGGGGAPGGNGAQATLNGMNAPGPAVPPVTAPDGGAPPPPGSGQQVDLKLADGSVQKVPAAVNTAIGREHNDPNGSNAETAYSGTPGQNSATHPWATVDASKLKTGDIVQWAHRSAVVVVTDQGLNYYDDNQLVPLDPQHPHADEHGDYGQFQGFYHPTGLDPTAPAGGAAGANPAPAHPGAGGSQGAATPTPGPGTTTVSPPAGPTTQAPTVNTNTVT